MNDRIEFFSNGIGVDQIENNTNEPLIGFITNENEDGSVDITITTVDGKEINLFTIPYYTTSDDAVSCNTSYAVKI